MSTPEYFVKIEYSVAVDGLSLTHVQRLRVVPSDGQDLPNNIGQQFDTINVISRGSAGSLVDESLRTVMSDYLTDFVAVYSADMSVINVVLEYYPYGAGASGIFIAAEDLSDTAYTGILVGTSLTATSPASQVTLSLYTDKGTVGKVVFLEKVGASNAIQGSGQLSAEWQAIVDELVGLGGWARGTGDSFYVALSRALFTQNEAVQRKRYRA